MTAFSPSDAAFEGFRIARERPRAILAWSVLCLVLSVLSAVVMILLAGDSMGELMALGATANPDPQKSMAVLGKLGPAFGALMLISLVAYAVLYTAIYRAALRPSQGGPFYLAAGADEARQLGALLLYWLAIMLVYFAVIIVAAILVALLSQIAPALGAIATALAIGAGLAAMLFIGVRLSLIGPIAFAERRIDPAASWRLTRTHFWPLFGAYALALVMSVLVFILGYAIMMGVAFAVAGGAQTTPDMTSLAAYFTAPTIVTLVLGAVISALMTAISVGASAHAYRAIAPNAAGVVETFS